MIVSSQAATRSEYLKRPDLGRLPASLSMFDRPRSESAGQDIGFVLADGLSPRALADHGVGLLDALVAELRGRLFTRTAGDRDPGPGRVG